MAYRNIPYANIADPELSKTFRHADMILSDVYSMFLYDAPLETNGGRGNFSIALILLCVADGLASVFGRKLAEVGDYGERFMWMVKENLPWQDGWADKGQATIVLHVEVRNSLTHELGKDIESRARHPGWDEPAIHKWHPKHKLTADELDGLERWPNEWPILFRGRNAKGAHRYELSSAALYWAVKRMTLNLLRRKPS